MRALQGRETLTGDADNKVCSKDLECIVSPTLRWAFVAHLRDCGSAQVHGGDPGRRAPGVSGVPAAVRGLGFRYRGIRYLGGQGSRAQELRVAEDDSFRKAPSEFLVLHFGLKLIETP